MFTSKKLSTILALSMLMSFAPSLCKLSADTKRHYNYGLLAATAVTSFYYAIRAVHEDDYVIDNILETKALKALALAFGGGFFYSKVKD